MAGIISQSQSHQYTLGVRDGAEFKNKRICPMGSMMYFFLRIIKKGISHMHSFSTVIMLFINTTH
jgi:hypothetical protein